MGGTWQAVNATPGAISIGGSMPVGQYVAEYPAAMQYAVLQVADGTFVPPDGQLNETAVAELAARAPIPANASGDWAYMYATPPGLYPILYWGFATVPRDLTAKGPRGHYIKDTGGCRGGLLRHAGCRRGCRRRRWLLRGGGREGWCEWQRGQQAIHPLTRVRPGPPYPPCSWVPSD